MYAFLRFPNFRNKAVTLSYDDGVDADARLIDIMQRYGLKGTFNINSGLIGNSKKRTHTVKELTELYLSTGNEVAVHGVKHLSLPNVDIATATREILDDRAALEQQFGGIIRGMAYAYGQYNDDVVSMLRACGIVYARTVVSTKKFNIPTDWLRMPATCHHNDPELFSLLDKFLSPATGDGTWAAPRHGGRHLGSPSPFLPVGTQLRI